MKNMLNALVVVFSLFAFACGDSAQGMVYQETKCADPWTNLSGSTNDDLKEGVENYFKDNMISFDSVYVTNDGLAQDCEACTCNADRRIHAEVADSEIATLKAIGFIEN